MTFWAREQQLYLESRQAEKMVDECSKELPYWSWNSGFFYPKRGGGGWLVLANFLVPESFVLKTVHVGQVTKFP